MKILIQPGQWRVRIDEEELAELLGGVTLTTHCELPGGCHLAFETCLSTGSEAQLHDRDGTWRIQFPRPDVVNLQARLPDREGIAHALATTSGRSFELRLQVDVKDSLRRRRPVRT